MAEDYAAEKNALDVLTCSNELHMTTAEAFAELGLSPEDSNNEEFIMNGFDESSNEYSDAKKTAQKVLKCYYENNQVSTESAITMLRDFVSELDDSQFDMAMQEGEETESDVIKRLISKAENYYYYFAERGELGGKRANKRRKTHKKRKSSRRNKRKHRTMKRGGKRYAKGGRKLAASQIDRIVNGEKAVHISLHIEHPTKYYDDMKKELKKLRFGQDVNLMQIRIYGEALRQAAPSSRP